MSELLGWRLDAQESLQKPLLILGLPVRVLIALLMISAVLVMVVKIPAASVAVFGVVLWIAGAWASKNDPAWWLLFTEQLRLPSRWM